MVDSVSGGLPGQEDVGGQPYDAAHAGADVTTGADTGTRIVAEWRRKYGKLEPEPVIDGVFRVVPRAIRA
jgi:hypothetical protein